MDVDSFMDQPEASTSFNPQFIVNSPSPASPKDLTEAISPSVDTLPLPQHTTGFVYDGRMMLHAEVRPLHSSRSMSPAGSAVDGYSVQSSQDDAHPECPERISGIFKLMHAQKLPPRMKRIEARKVTKREALLVHTEDHWRKVSQLESFSLAEIEASKDYYNVLSLYISPSTTLCAQLSCGAVIETAFAIMDPMNSIRNAFAIVRPPGHHAEPNEHMGFCFFNNVCVAAEAVREKYTGKNGGKMKILILDWDVHHGNGTQRAFYEDPDTLYISLHRYDLGLFYPNGPEGAYDRVGGGPGVGRNVNIPWENGGGYGDQDYIYAFLEVVMPIAHEWDPDLVIVSAGFDAAMGDPLGACEVSPGGFTQMLHMLMSLACGRVLVALEGGYNVDAISEAAVACTRTLLGEPPLPINRSKGIKEETRQVVWKVKREQSKWWNNISVPGNFDDHAEFQKLAPTYSLTSMIKLHRAETLMKEYDMFPMPLADPSLEEKFHKQVLITDDIYSAETLVFFVHDFGNLRMEFEKPRDISPKAELSYLIDSSTLIIDWVREKGYALIDINMLMPLELEGTYGKGSVQNFPKAEKKAVAALMLYLWDNIMSIGTTKNIVLMGYGYGSEAIMSLINERDVMTKTKAVVEVCAMNSLPRVAHKNNHINPWFKDICRVFVPSDHPRIQGHGSIVPIEQTKSIFILRDSIPQIKEFVDSRVSTRVPDPIDLLQSLKGGAGDEMTVGMDGVFSI